MAENTTEEKTEVKVPKEFSGLVEVLVQLHRP
jgi:hypothetical protein